jgi:hypothetical protein
MLPLTARLGLYARTAARRTAVAVAGGVLAAVGAGLLLAAVWIVLDQAFGAVAACLLLAAILMGLGAVLLLLRPPAPRLADPLAGITLDMRGGAGALPPLAAAFAFGLSLALQARRGAR